MGKITVFALLGLILIGSLGWSLGERPARPGGGHQDNLFASTNSPTGKSRIDTKMLEGWMLRDETPYLLIDTRPAPAFSQGHLLRVINREFAALLSLQSLRRLPRHKAIVIYGVNEHENAKAVDILRLAGLTAYYLPGGNASWAALPLDGSGHSTHTAARIAASAAPADKPPPTPLETEQHLDAPPQRGMTETSEQAVRVGMLED